MSELSTDVVVAADQAPQHRYQDRRSNATFIAGSIGLVAIALLLPTIPEAVFFVAPLLWGWSEVNGLCGSSHVCSLSMLRNWDSRSRLWLQAVSAYTLAGILTSATVGLTVGLVGRVCAISNSTALTILALAVIPLVFREMTWMSFPLPQVHRQTNKMWALQFGWVIGPGMWGAHIGIGFSTVIRHTGFYLLVILALGSGLADGAFLFIAYWLGRTLPMWVEPLVSRGGFKAEYLSLTDPTWDRACRYVVIVGSLGVLLAAIRVL